MKRCAAIREIVVHPVDSIVRMLPLYKISRTVTHGEVFIAEELLSPAQAAKSNSPPALCGTGGEFA